MSDDRFTVMELPNEHRYLMRDAEAPEAEVGEESYVDVEVDGVIERVLFHTGISEEYGGLGLASQLVQFVVDDLIASDRRIVPVCPYVKKWLMKHTDYADHVVAPRPDHLRAISLQQRAGADG